MKNWTAEEVRRHADFVLDKDYQEASKMLTAFAERIKADEGVVPVDGWKAWDENNPPPPGEYVVYHSRFKRPGEQIWSFRAAKNGKFFGEDKVRWSYKRGQCVWFNGGNWQADAAPEFYHPLPRYMPDVSFTHPPAQATQVATLKCTAFLDDLALDASDADTLAYIRDRFSVPTKPIECANGCPEQQICDYCQPHDGKDGAPTAEPAQAAQVVYVCSNQACRAAYKADPMGHCPTCVQPNGSGWSTLPREVL